MRSAGETAAARLRALLICVAVICCMGQSCGTFPPATVYEEEVLAEHPDAPPDGANDPAAPAAPELAIVSGVSPDGWSVDFAVTTLDGQPLPAATFTWDFGDGSSSEGSSVSHTYTKAGVYAVSVSAVIGAGITAYVLRTETEQVVQGPAAAQETALRVTPPDDLTSTGRRGGLFRPAGQTWTLTNTSAEPLRWTTAVTWDPSPASEWLALSQQGGTLEPGASTEVSATIDAGRASELPPGGYGAMVGFLDTTPTDPAARPRTSPSGRRVKLVVGLQIAGQVRRSGLGFAGVTISAEDGINPAVTAVTSETGAYELVVPAGFAGAVTPIMTGGAFDPPNLVYSNLAADVASADFVFTGQPQAIPLPGIETYVGVPVEIPLAGIGEDLPLDFRIVEDGEEFEPGPHHGTLSPIRVSPSGVAATVTYSPTAGYVGEDSFKFVVEKGRLCSPSSKVEILIKPLPALTIRAEPSSITAGQAVTFTAVDGTGQPASNLPASLRWDFGDGARADDLASVTHTFAAARTATVTLSLNFGGSAVAAVASTTVSVYPATGNRDADGWTVFRPSADTRVVYVSSSLGDDVNYNGLAPEPDDHAARGTDGRRPGPVQTLAKGRSLLRVNQGYPDWILLKRGDVWNEGFGNIDVGGRSVDEPAVFGAYGLPVPGKNPRPVINSTSAALGVGGFGPHWVAIVGVEFVGNGTSHGVSIMSPVTSTLLVEDCLIRDYAFNLVFQGVSATVNNVTVRRCVIVDAYSAAGGYSSGLYLDKVHNVLVEECFFDHNGWREADPVAPATIFDHNIYMQSNCSGYAVFRNNIIARGASHGIQARSGATVTDNLFIDNAIHVLIGGGNTVDLPAGGVTGRVENNVFFGSKTIDTLPRGYGAEFVNTRVGGNSTLANNLFVGDEDSIGAAITLSPIMAVVQYPSSGINDLTISGNVVYNWGINLQVHLDLVPGGTGRVALTDLEVTGNKFQAVQGSPIVLHGPSSLAESTFSKNTYDAAADRGRWFRIANSAVPFDTWKRDVEIDAADLSYPGAAVDVGSYDATAGGSGTKESFLALTRQQTRTRWDPRYTAAEVVRYLRSGYGLPTEQ